MNENKKPQTNPQGKMPLVVGILSMLYGAFVSIQVVELIVKPGDPGRLGFLVRFLLIFLSAGLVSIVVGIALHEIGHVLAGKIGGMRMQFLELAHWRWVPTATGFERKTLKQDGLGGVGGRAAMLPTTKTSRAGLTLHYAGGVLVNLLLASPLLFLPWETGGLVAAWWACFAFMQIYLFFTNALPLQLPNILTDGAVIRLLLTPGDGDRFLEISRIDGLLLEGKRPDQIARLDMNSERPLLRIQEAMFSMMQALATGDAARAESLLEVLDPEKLPQKNTDEISRMALLLLHDTLLGQVPYYTPSQRWEALRATAGQNGLSRWAYYLLKKKEFLDGHPGSGEMVDAGRAAENAGAEVAATGAAAGPIAGAADAPHPPAGTASAEMSSQQKLSVLHSLALRDLDAEGLPGMTAWCLLLEEKYFSDSRNELR